MSANIENKKQVVDSIKSEIQAAKSVVFVNYKGFYNGFLHQISKQIKEGLFPEYEFEKVVTVVKNVDEAISHIPPLSRFNRTK